MIPQSTHSGTSYVRAIFDAIYTLLIYTLMGTIEVDGKRSKTKRWRWKNDFMVYGMAFEAGFRTSFPPYYSIPFF